MTNVETNEEIVPDLPARCRKPLLAKYENDGLSGWNTKGSLLVRAQALRRMSSDHSSNVV